MKTAAPNSSPGGATGARNRGNAREYFPAASWVCTGQGWFYLITGAWPLLHPASFEFATGAKRDFWLAQTVGALLVVSGIAMISAAKAGRITREIAILALGEAIALGVADIATLWQPRTALSYLADAMVEFGLVALWSSRLLGRPGW